MKNLLIKLAFCVWMAPGICFALEGDGVQKPIESQNKKYNALRLIFKDALDCYASAYMLGSYFNDNVNILSGMELGRIVIEQSAVYGRRAIEIGSRLKLTQEEILGRAEQALVKYDRISKRIEGGENVLINSDLFANYFNCKINQGRILK